MEQLKYPIGKFSYPDTFTQIQINEWIDEIAAAPKAFREKVENMSAQQIETPYRPGGWTGRQVMHHVPDSHLQAYGRFKLVLTEEAPVIKPYREDLWAKLTDTNETPLDVSIGLLEALHIRWVNLMRSMTMDDFQRYYIHPEYGKQYKLGAVCKLYAWHGKHHLAHLELIRQQG